MTFEEIVEGVLHREGGYVDHPNDPGGETKYGIAKRSHPDEDIKNMTMDRAADIYEKDYWKPSKATSLPKSMQECYFDMVVNMGQRRAVKILQKACNSKGCSLVVDGLIGKATIGACKSLEASRFRAFRVKYYVELVSRKPTLMKYYFGWFRRVIEA